MTKTENALASHQPPQTLSILTVVKFAGAILATLIGSGFASGQETMQFFAAYGLLGIVGSVIAVVLFGALGGVLLGYGFLHRRSENFSVFRHFCGKYLGSFLEWFTILFCFLVGVVMVSGSGATINQYFGIPQVVGSALMAVLVLISSLFGMRRIVDIIGAIGPVAVVFLIVLAGYTFIVHWDGLAHADASIVAAGSSVVYGVGSSAGWFAAGAFMYVAYNTLAGCPFLSELGTRAHSRKEALLSGIIGGAVLGLCAMIINLALLSTYGEVSHFEVPVLHMAQQISPVIGFVFTIVLLSMIYNTAVPMVWTVANEFVDEHKNRRGYQILVTILCVLFFVGGQFPFGTLVNVIYPFVGYFGALFIVVVAVQLVRWRLDCRRSATKIGSDHDADK